MASQYGDTNPNSYILSDYETEPSDYLFPDMRYMQENDVLSTHLQLPPEVSNAFMNQNPQNYESSIQNTRKTLQCLHLRLVFYRDFTKHLIEEILFSTQLIQARAVWNWHTTKSQKLG
ncbi:hypothetical protein CDAR_189421 [Caerostris darwini]|uniref:Uncharacterized protein n=1 Tax=Caerostris darwini TaxID=1538125 RepID=A0AAV4QW17_9ARAC|nr:hypothetical protein CDAR_189421 [Caerostris darwini]